MNGEEGNGRTAPDGRFGFRQLDPRPSPSEVEEFYRTRYANLVREGGRAPDVGRLMAGGPEAEREREWLRHTLWADVEELLRGGGCRRVLEVGCGTGDLLAYLAEGGFETTGIEPSAELAEVARGRGLRVHAGELGGVDRGSGWNAALLLNVLEHVDDPLGCLDRVRELLATDGLLVVRVPNDFTPLQRAAQEALGREPWWVRWPDHLSYFDFSSLGRVLDDRGFEVLDRMGDFPMELFLLMGDDYLADAGMGSLCHGKRRQLEMSLPPNLRRSLYRAFAAAGVGRNCLLVARRRRAGGGGG